MSNKPLDERIEEIERQFQQVVPGVVSTNLSGMASKLDPVWRIKVRDDLGYLNIGNGKVSLSTRESSFTKGRLSYDGKTGSFIGESAVNGQLHKGSKDQYVIVTELNAPWVGRGKQDLKCTNLEGKSLFEYKEIDFVDETFLFMDRNLKMLGGGLAINLDTGEPEFILCRDKFSEEFHKKIKQKYPACPVINAPQIEHKLRYHIDGRVIIGSTVFGLNSDKKEVFSYDLYDTTERVVARAPSNQPATIFPGLYKKNGINRPAVFLNDMMPSTMPGESGCGIVVIDSTSKQIVNQLPADSFILSKTLINGHMQNIAEEVIDVYNGNKTHIPSKTFLPMGNDQGEIFYTTRLSSPQKLELRCSDNQGDRLVSELQIPESDKPYWNHMEDVFDPDNLGDLYCLADGTLSKYQILNP